MQNTSANYLLKCDSIIRTPVNNINEILKVNRIIILLSSSQSNKTENPISSSDTNFHLKILLMFYFMFGINPKISYHQEKKLNYKQEEKENDTSYSYKVILENSEDIEKIINYFFVDNDLLMENSIPTFSCLNNALNIKYVVPTIIDSEIEEIFSQNSKETFPIKDLQLTVNFIINSHLVSKTEDMYSVFPFSLLPEVES